jgi:hypothetical protein
VPPLGSPSSFLFSLVEESYSSAKNDPKLFIHVTVVVGSFSDVIGQALPVAIPLDAFHGYFTTLVPRAVDDCYQLPQSTQEPDTIPPPVQQDDEEDIQDQPTIGRLHFYMDVNIPENRPVIAAFPHCLERKKPSTTHRWPFLTVTDSPHRD